MRTGFPNLSVILPAYNESEGLSIAIQTYLDSLREFALEDFEILIVNDGSTDGTGELADKLAAEDPRIRVIHQDHNMGQAASILHGFQEASGEIVTHNGMDLPFHPRDIPRILSCFGQGADVVVVERADRSAYGLARRIVSWCNILLLRSLFDTQFRDHNFVQFYRREVVESIEVRSAGVSTVTVELILRAQRHGYCLSGITAEYHKREAGKSTITPGKVVHTLLETLRLWWLFRLPDRRVG